MSGASGDQPDEPALRVVRGQPSPEELAALVAVLAARRSGAATPPPTPVARWADRAAALRRPLPHGPGAWHASAWWR